MVYGFISCVGILVVWVYIEYGSIAIPYILMYMSLQQHFSVAWFLAAMFFGKLMFTLICKYCKSLRSIMIVSWFIGLLGILYAVYIRVLFFWALDLSLVAVLFLSFGYFLKQKDVFIVIKNTGAPVLFMLLCLCSSLIWTFFDVELGYATLDMFNNNYGLPILTIPSALMGSFAIIMFSGYIQNCKFLRYLGENSIYFFLLHKPVFIRLAFHICDYLGWTNYDTQFEYIRVVGSSFIIVMICCEISHQLIVAILRLYKRYKPCILVDK